MNVAVDLLWVRHNKVGGIESCARNLLDGIKKIEVGNIKFILFVSKDNYETFKQYTTSKNFDIVICDVLSENIGKRIIWQNMKLGSILKKNNIEICIEPYYCKPFFGVNRIKFVTTIHDLQAIHYPEYFSKFKVLWMKASWKNAIKKSEKIIAISQFVKNDIIKNYDVNPSKIEVIYDAININPEDIIDFEKIKKKYNIEEKSFFFTVSSLLPHKNLKTIINIMSKIKECNMNLPNKLIISGVGGKSRDELNKLIKEKNLKESILITDFISDAERNTLYKNCRAFLFPSIFEGFGMPPIEAMIFGTPVITTKMTSIPEVSKNKAIYVSNPFDEQEWIEAIKNCPIKIEKFNANCYNKEVIAKKYIDLLISLKK